MGYTHAFSPSPGTVVYIDDTTPENTETRRGGTRSWRNNNPGNLPAGGFATTHGAIGSDGIYAIFPSRQAGVTALSAFLNSPANAELTLAAVVRNRLSPEDAQEVQEYQAYVEEQIGEPRTKLLRDLVNVNAHRERLITVIERLEGWKEGITVKGSSSTAFDLGQSLHNHPRSAGALAADEWMAVAEAEAALPAPLRTEIPGPDANPTILKYWQAVRHHRPTEGDETPWCAAFVNWCLAQAGYDGTWHPGARSFARNWGVRVGTPVWGCITVLSNEQGVDPQGTWAGHVGFFVRQQGDSVFLLGGNQGNTVNISRYDTKGPKYLVGHYLPHRIA